jgi:tRNA pseudouridine38-40 synthase
MRLLLTIAYDGSGYSGWQRQNNAVTIQQRLEEALEAVFGRHVSTIGASRTDAGVHALCQKACFSLETCKIPLEKLCQVLNNYLPDDICARAVEEVTERFNPRFCAADKTYAYQIWHDKYPNPFVRHTSLFFPYALDIHAMNCAAVHFIGKHDFNAFRSVGTEYHSTVRTIFECSVAEKAKLIIITVRGDSFLYNMVRIMAGTLLYVGQGKIDKDRVKDIIRLKDRRLAGRTVPPHGLTLMDIRY